jgi:molecular chaperone DnaK
MCIQGHIDALKKALEGTDGEQIKAKTALLQEHMQKIGEELAKAGGADGADPNAGAAGAQQQQPDIEDAEVEINDKK